MPVKKTKKVEAESTALVIPQKELDTYKKESSAAVKYATDLKVTSDADYADALKNGKAIKERLDFFTNRKELITKPMNAALKSIRELFKPIESDSEIALGIIKPKMLAYTAEQNRKAEEAKAKIVAKVEDGKMTTEKAIEKIDAIATPEKSVSTGAGTATTRTVKKFRVTDITKIPHKFLEPNMVMIKASFKAGSPVAGVEEYEEQELALS